MRERPPAGSKACLLLHLAGGVIIIEVLDQWKKERLDKLYLVSLADALVYINMTFSRDQNPSYPLAVVHHSFSHYKSQHPLLSKFPTFKAHIRIARRKCSQGRIPCTQLVHACILSIRHLFSQRRYHLPQSSSYVRKLQMCGLSSLISSVLQYVASRQATFSVPIPLTLALALASVLLASYRFHSLNSLFKTNIQKIHAGFLLHAFTMQDNV